MQSYYLTGFLSVSSNYPSHLKKTYKKYNDIIVNPQVEELAIEGSCVALLRESI